MGSTSDEPAAVAASQGRGSGNEIADPKGKEIQQGKIKDLFEEKREFPKGRKEKPKLEREQRRKEREKTNTPTFQ